MDANIFIKVVTDWLLIFLGPTINLCTLSFLMYSVLVYPCTSSWWRFRVWIYHYFYLVSFVDVQYFPASVNVSFTLIKSFLVWWQTVRHGKVMREVGVEVVGLGALNLTGFLRDQMQQRNMNFESLYTVRTLKEVIVLCFQLRTLIAAFLLTFT